MAAPEREPGNNGEVKEAFVQHTLEGFEPPPLEEVLLPACLVLTEPILTTKEYYKEKYVEWSCRVFAQPLLFEPDRESHYELLITTPVQPGKHKRSKPQPDEEAPFTAQEANRKHLMPGDVVSVWGTLLRTQTLERQDGETS